MHIMLSKYSTSSYCLPSMVVLQFGIYKSIYVEFVDIKCFILFKHVK